MWLEGRVYIEYLRLIRDPVYRGIEVPPGLGRPVLLIPGFLAGDWTLRTPFQWLRRVGYNPQMGGVAFNVMYSEMMLRPLINALQHLKRRTGARVALIGHSRGGVLAKVLSHRNPELVEQVITLGSPLGAPFDVHPLTMAGVRAAHAYNVFRYGHPASVEKRFLRDLAAPPRVPAPRRECDRGQRQSHRPGTEPRGVSNPGATSDRAVADAMRKDCSFSLGILPLLG